MRCVAFNGLTKHHLTKHHHDRVAFLNSHRSATTNRGLTKHDHRSRSALRRLVETRVDATAWPFVAQLGLYATWTDRHGLTNVA